MIFWSNLKVAVLVGAVALLGTGAGVVSSRIGSTQAGPPSQAASPAKDAGVTPQQLAYQRRKARVEAIRSILLAKACRDAVPRAETNLQLLTKMEGAGMVTKIDVYDAEVRLSNRRVASVIADRQREKALREVKRLGGDPVDPFADLVVDFADAGGATAAETQVRSDRASGVVAVFAMKDEQPAGKLRTLFEPVSFDEKAVLEEAGEDSARDEIRDAAAELNVLKEILLNAGERVAQARRKLETSRIMWKRGLCDIAAIFHAQEEVHKAQTEFINDRLDYVAQVAAMDLAMGAASAKHNLFDAAIKSLKDGLSEPKGAPAALRGDDWF